MRNVIIAIQFLFLAHLANANHLRGGEITFDCLEAGSDQGKLMFYVKLYQTCSAGTASLPSSISLNNPLYATYGGVSSIACSRFSITDISTGCFDTSQSIRCGLPNSNPRSGYAYEEHLYISSPVQVNGTPSVSGSAFSYSSCCRATSLNATGSSYYLRVVLYPYTDPTTNIALSMGSIPGGATCYDNGPVFTEKLPFLQQRGRMNYFSLNSIDVDCDSLSYDRSLSAMSSINFISWNTGYSDLYPFGNNSSNIPLAINSATGWASHFSISNPGLYELCQKVTSYKNQQKVSEVYRDYTALLISDTLSPNNGPPVISFKNNSASAFASIYSDTFNLGDSIHINIKASDVGFISPSIFQTVSLKILPHRALNQTFNPWGCNFSNCATLDTNNIYWTGTNFEGSPSVFVDFKWKAECEHMNQCGNPTDYNPEYETYTFGIVATDNVCLAQLSVIAEFSITIQDTSKPVAPLREIIISDSTANILWNRHKGPPFAAYKLYRSDSVNGSFILLDSITNINDTSYVDSNSLGTKIPRYYKLVSTGTSICEEDGNVAKSIVLSVVDTINYNSVLHWNSMYFSKKPAANGKYVIEFNTGSGWNQLDSMSHSAFLTSFYTYVDTINTCTKDIAYRIRAEDLTNNISYRSNIDSANFTYPIYPDTIIICSSDSILLGGVYRNSSGLYLDTLQTFQGCDSLIEVNLIVNPAYEIDTSVTICKGDTAVIYGIQQVVPAIYSKKFKTQAGCDSLVHTELIVNKVNRVVTTNGRVLTADATPASYQWVACPGYTVIPGATSKSYAPSVNGQYAVIVTELNCIDTSSCKGIWRVGVDESNLGDGIKVYPNPTNEILTFEFEGKKDQSEFLIEVRDYKGSTILKENGYGANHIINCGRMADGIYFYTISTKSEKLSGRFSVKH